MPTVVAAMTPFPYSVDQAADIADAAEMMREHHFGHLPVTHDGRVVGILRRRDIAVARAAYGDARREAPRTVGLFCGHDPYVVELGAPLDEVVAEMSARQVDAAVVLRHGKLAGILTSTDVCRYLADLLVEVYRPPGGGAAA
jgi:CBS domain-containing protein